MANLLVMSNKGGVGKTTIAINLAYLLSKEHKVGLLDIDIHGPNVPIFLNLDEELKVEDKKILPVLYKGMYIISTAFLSKNAVIWRGPIKTKLIYQFLNDVKWPELDYLVVDLPPGTGDETITIMKLLEDAYSIIVSMPQSVSLKDASKAIETSKKLGVPVLGVIENMSGEIFGKGKVKEFADKTGVSFLGEIPLDKRIIECSNEGVIAAERYPELFSPIVENILNKIKRREQDSNLRSP